MPIARTALEHGELHLGSRDKSRGQLAGSNEGTAIRKTFLETAAQSKQVTCTREDAERIVAALKRPFEPNAALKRAMKEASEIEANALAAEQ